MRKLVFCFSVLVCFLCFYPMIPDVKAEEFVSFPEIENDNLQSDINEYMIVEEIFDNNDNLLSESIDPSINSTEASNQYDSENFRIHYDANVPENVAEAVAVFMEQMRIDLINSGFREPLKQLFHSRYQVYLNTGPGDPETSAVSIVGVRARTKIDYNSFPNPVALGDNDSLPMTVKCNLAHEYFHATEAAYFWSVYNGWFDEGCCGWNVVNYCKTIDFVHPMNSYILTDDSILNIGSSANCIIPLTIQKEFGYNTVVEIWEEAAQLSSVLISKENFISNVIDVVLSRHGSSFDEIYEKAMAYVLDINTNFLFISNGLYDFNMSTLPYYYLSNVSTMNNDQFNYLFSGNVNKYATSYKRIEYRRNGNDLFSNPGLIRFEVLFDGNDRSKGVVVFRKKTGNNLEYQTVHANSNGRVEILAYIDDISQISEITLGITSLSSQTLSYTVNYRASFGKKYSVNLSSTTRMYEKREYISAGGFVDYYVRSYSGGNYCIQTFGELYVIIKLYDENNNLIMTNGRGGREPNAFINYYLEPNKMYRVNITAISNSTGYTRLMIVPGNYSNYSSIPRMTSNTYTSYVGTGSVGMVRYTASQSGNHVISLLSSYDTYLYVIDPLNSNVCVNYNSLSVTVPSLYNDDSNGSLQSSLETYLTAGHDYLIVYCFYNPSSSSGSISVNIAI